MNWAYFLEDHVADTDTSYVTSGQLLPHYLKTVKMHASCSTIVKQKVQSNSVGVKVKIHMKALTIIGILFLFLTLVFGVCLFARQCVIFLTAGEGSTTLLPLLPRFTCDWKHGHGRLPIN